MNLTLELSSHDLTSSARASLESITRSGESLDGIEAQMRSTFTAHFWIVTRGGHHVALNYKPIAGHPFRVAMIGEAS